MKNQKIIERINEILNQDMWLNTGTSGGNFRFGEQNKEVVDKLTKEISDYILANFTPKDKILEKVEIDIEEVEKILHKWQDCCRKGQCCSSCIEDKRMGFKNDIDVCCCKHYNTCDTATALAEAGVIKIRGEK